MKRTVLIPLLLSTFLLVGCESELDKCFEANYEYSSLDIDNFKRTKLYPYFEQMNEEGLTLDEFGKSIDLTEKTFMDCSFDVSNDLEERKDSRWKFYQARRLPSGRLSADDAKDYLEIIEAICLQKEEERAKAVCHSQGVY